MERFVRFYDPVTGELSNLIQVNDAPAARIHSAFLKWLGNGEARWEVVEDDGESDISTLAEIENSDSPGVRDA
jgi:hypothetical protein